VDEFFDTQMYSVSTSLEKGAPGWNMEIVSGYLNKDEYVGDDLVLRKYLAMLQRPGGLMNT